MAEHIVISAPFFVALFWTLWLGLDYRNRPERVTFRLFCFMLTTTVLYACHFVYFSRGGHAPWWMDALYRYCNLAVFPLWYFYLRELTLQRTSRREMFLWLMPAVLIAAASSVWDGALPLARMVFAVQVVAVVILGFHLLRSFRKLVFSSYSDTEAYSLCALHWLLVFLSLTSLVSFAANLLGREHFLSSIGLLAIPSMLFSAFIFMLGYEADRLLPISKAVRDEVETMKDEELRMDDSLQSLSPDEENHSPRVASTEGDAGSELEADRFAELQREVLRAMDEDKLYLQPGLKISDLAQHLGSNRNYIWHAVNEGLGVSFSELVNRRRIDHFVSLAEQGPEFDIDEAWQKCGFTSASTFYRCFRLYKGCSPAEYFSGEATGKET